MVINNTVFDTDRVKLNNDLLYDINNTLLDNFELSFRIANDDNHIFVEMSYKIFKALEYVYIGNYQLNIEYYQCNIFINKISKMLTVSGIVISKFDFDYDNIIILGFNNKCLFSDKYLKIYSLCKYQTFYSILPFLNVNDNAIKNCISNESEIQISMNKLNFINESIEKEITKIVINENNRNINNKINCYYTEQSSESSTECVSNLFEKDFESSDNNHKIILESDTFNPIFSKKNNSLCNNKPGKCVDKPKKCDDKPRKYDNRPKKCDDNPRKCDNRLKNCNNKPKKCNYCDTIHSDTNYSATDHSSIEHSDIDHIETILFQHEINKKAQKI
jgi:hypothetical protein